MFSQEAQNKHHLPEEDKVNICIKREDTKTTECHYQVNNTCIVQVQKIPQTNHLEVYTLVYILNIYNGKSKQQDIYWNIV